MSEEEKKEFFKKREVILETLKLIFNEWDMAEPLYEYVNSSKVTPNMIDTLIKMIDISFNNIEDDDKREKMQNAMNSLKNIKQKETNDRNQDYIESELVLNNLF